MNRIIDSFRKVSSHIMPAFSISIIILACERYYMRTELAATDVFVMTWLFFSIDILSTITFAMEGWHKWAGVPYWVKRLISMPFLIAIVVSGLPMIFDMNSRSRMNGLLIGSIFATAYIVISALRYYSQKKQTDEMNDALFKLKKEISENEQEG